MSRRVVHFGFTFDYVSRRSGEAPLAMPLRPRLWHLLPVSCNPPLSWPLGLRRSEGAARRLYAPQRGCGHARVRTMHARSDQVSAAGAHVSRCTTPARSLEPCLQRLAARAEQRGLLSRLPDQCTVNEYLPVLCGARARTHTHTHTYARTHASFTHAHTHTHAHTQPHTTRTTAHAQTHTHTHTRTHSHSHSHTHTHSMYTHTRARVCVCVCITYACPHERALTHAHAQGQGIRSHIDTHSAFEDGLMSVSLGAQVKTVRGRGGERQRGKRGGGAERERKRKGEREGGGGGWSEGWGVGS